VITTRIGSGVPSAWANRVQSTSASAAALRGLPAAFSAWARFAAALLFLGVPPALHGETLGDVIAKAQALSKVTQLANLQESLLSHAVLDDERWFVVAYYLADDTPPSERLLFIDRYDRSRQTWASASLPAEERRVGDADCLGLGMSLDVWTGGFQLGTHLNPSAECLLLISSELEVRAALCGWRLASFADGSLIYHRCQVHFAPVHALEVGLWNSRTGRDYTLFPRQPFQRIRLAEIEKQRAFFQENLEWCDIHNHPCDADWINSSLQGNVVVNETSDAVAFVVDYGSDPDNPNAPPVSLGHRKAVYVYRKVRDESSLEFRELSPHDIEARFGNVGLSELLTRSNLNRIFGQ